MGDFVADQKFFKKDFRNQRLPKGDYENCAFEECLFQKGYLDNQNFIECTFIGCDFTNTNIVNTQFNEVTFVECKLMGVRFETCDPLLSSLQFEECNMSLASFYGKDMSNSFFKGCKIHHVDFTMTNLSKCSFAECDFQDALFEESNLEGANFSSAINFNIDPSKNLVKKAKFSKSGLIGLLKKYDIVVE